jgi:hypothetical protein
MLLGIVAVQVEARLFGYYRPRTFWVVLFAVGGGVMVGADRLGMIKSPYEAPPMNLRGHPEVDETPAKETERT